MAFGSFRSAGLVLLCLSVPIAGCDHNAGQDVSPAASSSSREPQPASPDRLAPGELAPGNETVFGFRLPRAMVLEASFPKSAHAVGRVSAESLAGYVRRKVSVQHVELAAGKMLFPSATIKGGQTHRLYRFEITSRGTRSRLVITDITPEPTVQGLTQEERWKRAGLTPSGKLLNPNQLE